MHPKVQPQHRRLLIYGGLAAGVLLLLLLSRRNSAGQAATPVQTAAAPPVDTSGAGGGGSFGSPAPVDNSALLSQIDTDLNSLGSDQTTLSQQIAGFIQSAQTPGPTPSTDTVAAPPAAPAPPPAGTTVNVYQQGTQGGSPAGGAGGKTRTAARPPAPKNPVGGGHFVYTGKAGPFTVNGWQLIHATGKNQWAPGPPKGQTFRTTA